MGDPSNTHPVLLIGIGGASCSGKSTLADWLATILKIPIIHQDQFYKTDAKVPVIDGIQDWDSPASLDMSSFVSKLHDVKHRGTLDSILGKNRSSINTHDLSIADMEALRNAAKLALEGVRPVLVDGFLLYDDPDVYDALDLRLFLYAGRETLQERREKRTGYVTLEGFWQDPPEYFTKFVWPRYLQHNGHILHHLTPPETTPETSPPSVLRPPPHPELEKDGARTVPLGNTLEGVYAISSEKLNVAEMVKTAVAYVVAAVEDAKKRGVN
ncbi:ribosylnicotinamide kinase [Phlyctochytrium bullatum]|nr:ribosylnicotinamide kinase [Phlyctochytrium bullatum]